MTEQKIDNVLNLALDASDEELNEAYDLKTGYDEIDDVWEVIIRYNGDLDELIKEGISVTYLLAGYAILKVPKQRLAQVSRLSQVIYMEKPKSLYFAVNDAKADSCFQGIQTRRGGVLSGLTGRGTIVAVIDSGVDYYHPDFIKPDGTTRILYLWDQSSVAGSPPMGYGIGTEYTSEDINNRLTLLPGESGTEQEVGTDFSGHGTHVLGIAAGNGRASNGKYAGCAPESDIIVVKLGRAGDKSFPMTSELMQGIDYVIRKAVMLNMPVAVNISYGNSYGRHSGDSIIENYIDAIAGIGKNVVVVGAGNEGVAGRHASGVLSNNSENVELAVYEYTTPFSIQIWKNYYDDFQINVYSPEGDMALIRKESGTGRYSLGNTELLVYYGEPTPYNINQEIYIEMIPDGGLFESGIWRIELVPVTIVSGAYDMWLPSGAAISTETAFLTPASDTTLTIPSTGRNVITVGAYDSATDAIASFSGRGYTAGGNIKPDIVAPGVDIISAAPGGGYTSRTGTSMATPFVTGAASCMMQWGITEGKDIYLYGEKLKAYLINGAVELPGFSRWPNPIAGYGALCVEDSIPE